MMTEQEPAEAGQAITDTLDALRRTVAAIDAIPDPQQALERARELRDSLLATTEELGALRQRKASDIREARKFDLAGLGDRVSMPQAHRDRLEREGHKPEAAPPGEKEPG